MEISKRKLEYVVVGAVVYYEVSKAEGVNSGFDVYMYLGSTKL